MDDGGSSGSESSESSRVVNDSRIDQSETTDLTQFEETVYDTEIMVEDLMPPFEKSNSDWGYVWKF